MSYSTTNTSFIQNLKNKIEELIPIVDLMFDNSSVYYHDFNDQYDNIVILGAPLYHYDKKDEKTQILLKIKYEKFFENFELILDKAHPDRLGSIKEKHWEIINLIQQNHAPSTIEDGKNHFRQLIKVYNDFLDLLNSTESNLILIPDTNSIIQYPDPTTYRKIANGEFYFIIVPTVLSELDKLKTFHRDQDFKNKVKAAIKRLKGFNNQGNTLEGITVDKNITVKMIATEPKFDKSLKWLDSASADDRIIASILDIQLSHPSDQVIFITSDINLQNKSRLANLSYIDTDNLE